MFGEDWCSAAFLHILIRQLLLSVCSTSGVKSSNL